jgi:hypothetical protein
LKKSGGQYSDQKSCKGRKTGFFIPLKPGETATGGSSCKNRVKIKVSLKNHVLPREQKEATRSKKTAPERGGGRLKYRLTYRRFQTLEKSGNRFPRFGN